MNSPRIALASCPGVSPEGELSVPTKIYALAIQKCQDSKKGTHPGAPEDAKGSKNVSRHTNYTR
jgi:hypothetical protein